ncbi:tetratricopeptide repeat protein [Streptomyces bobili]|uniref:tetratricopeptide repeat protein n=1 Tax=Streptomyces bobili TaxID=67280 RepID=UPI0022513C99|nr:tetratricopeptide repeat protein [Streptomyces bobili]MCX5523112.1 tetratricopeptide repeat protein [Streptomyces bobili]
MAPRTNDGEPERERPASLPAATAPVTETASGEAPGAAPGEAAETADASDTEGGRAAGSAEETGEAPESAADADADRVAAVRRVAAAGRRWRSVQLGACAAMLAVGLTAGAIALGAVRDGGATPVAAAAALSPGLLAGADLSTGIASLQAHLRDQPRDFGGWATLGLAYVEQARTQGDPSRYPQAEQALDRSVALRPDNDQALAGRAALAAARHEFGAALAHADRSLKQNPYNERALCSRIDALVELGRYEEASAAARTADERRPGVPVFTRYAYVHELRGDVTTARRVLDQALAASTTPGDIAYVATQLGQLAWNQGAYDTALTHYARALAADENYLPALEGRARAQAASGRRAEAIQGLENVVARFPLPGPLVELGELYEARGGEGDAAKAEAQYRLVDAWTALARANGVNADLDTALAAADHGDKAAALRAARAEWDRRRTVHTADALAWALHVNGKDDEALPYARRATATGYGNAALLYHRGVIERATGHPDEARTHLTAALKLNPGFSVLGAREARSALKTLEAAK